MNRWTSRKFIMAMAAQSAGIVAMLWPKHGDQLTAVIEAVAGLVVVILAALGYASAEASVDRAKRREAGDTK